MGEAYLSSSSLSPTFNQRLHFFLQNRPESWIYSIFWLKSNDPSGQFSLSWGDGIFRGNDHSSEIAFNSYFEWFYTASLNLSFGMGQGIIGSTFSCNNFVWLSGVQELEIYQCERVKEAKMHGIRTIVCVSTLLGVLELGSSEIVTQDWTLVQLAKSVFGAGHDLSTIPLHIPSNDPCFSPDVINSLEKRKRSETITQVLRSSSDSGHASDHSSDGTFQFGCTDDDVRPLKNIKGGRKKANSGGKKSTYPTNHVEAERERRERLNRRFCALRSVVPKVSKMDKASLLADTVTYIKELKQKNEELETKLQEYSADQKITAGNTSTTRRSSADYTSFANNQRWASALQPSNYNYFCKKEKVVVDVKIVGSQGLIRVQSPDVNYPAARLMDALSKLELKIHHGSLSCVQDLVLMDVVIKIPNAGVFSEEVVRNDILEKMHN